MSAKLMTPADRRNQVGKAMPRRRNGAGIRAGLEQ